MDLIKYIIKCIIMAVGSGYAKGFSEKEKITMIIWGTIFVLILMGICSLFTFKIYKNKRFNVLYGILSTLGLLLAFFGVCILIEWLIKLF